MRTDLYTPIVQPDKSEVQLQSNVNEYPPNHKHTIQLLTLVRVENYEELTNPYTDT